MSPSRRDLLRGVLLGPLLAVAACSRPRTAARSPSLPVSSPDPDAPLVAAAVTRERALLAGYDAQLASADGRRRQQLMALRAEHAVHLEHLKHWERRTATTPAPASPALPTPSAPADPVRALAALAALERRTSDAHADAVLLASASLAALLAQLAASEASHPVVLE